METEGLLDHDRRGCAPRGAGDVREAEGVTDLVVDDVGAIVVDLSVPRCAVGPAPRVDDNVPAVAAREPPAGV